MRESSSFAYHEASYLFAYVLVRNLGASIMLSGEPNRVAVRSAPQRHAGAGGGSAPADAPRRGTGTAPRHVSNKRIGPLGGHSPELDPDCAQFVGSCCRAAQGFVLDQHHAHLITQLLAISAYLSLWLLAGNAILARRRSGENFKQYQIAALALVLRLCSDCSRVCTVHSTARLFSDSPLRQMCH